MDAIVIVFIVFMSFVSIMCVFAMLIVLRDLIWNERQKRGKEDKPSRITKEKEKPTAKEVEKVEPIEEPEAVVEATLEEPTEPIKDIEVAVTFVPPKRKTLSEMYEELPRVYRGFYDEIAKHAEECADVTRHVKNDSYEEWKIGVARLVRLKIKKGMVISEFILQNSEMKEHIQESNVSVKQALTAVKLEDHNSVLFVIKSMDLVVKVLAEERERKKEERAKARREKRKAEAK